MTGSRVALRRWSGCNLHWRSPVLKRHRYRNYFDPPPIYNRYKLYITEDAADPWSAQGSKKYGRDRHGPYAWMITDCGWEWLATRPGIYHTPPLYRLFNALHDHVHTKHRENRVNLALAAQRAAVRLLRSQTLDERWGTNVYPDAHAYRVSFRVRDLADEELYALVRGLPDPAFSEVTLSTAQLTIVDWRERASSPHHAMRRAQQRVTDLGVRSGGFWETPIRLKTEETAA